MFGWRVTSLFKKSQTKYLAYLQRVPDKATHLHAGPWAARSWADYTSLFKVSVD